MTRQPTSCNIKSGYLSQLKQKKETTLENISHIINLALKAVALAMGVVSIILGLIPDAADASTQITLLSIGLFALALTALQKED